MSSPMLPYQPTQPPKRHRVRTVVLISIGGVLLLGGVSAALAGVSTDVGTRTAVTHVGSSTAGAAQADTPTTDPAPATPAETVASMGDTLTVTEDDVDAGELTASAPTASTNSPGEFLEGPANGFYVTITVTAKATGAGVFSVNPFDFYVRTGDGQHLDVTDGNAYEAAKDNDLDAVDLNPGENVKGSITFDLPAPHGSLVYAPAERALGSWTF